MRTWLSKSDWIGVLILAGLLFFYADAQWLRLFEQKLYSLTLHLSPYFLPEGQYALPRHYTNTGEPAWLMATQWLVFGFVLIHLLFVSRYLDHKRALIISLFFLGLLYIALCWVLFEHSVWLRLATAVNLLIYGQLLLLALQPVVMAVKHTRGHSARELENQFHLGHSFLEQGHLDWAFDKFKLSKPSRKLRQALYSLAEAYEDKGLSHRAMSVYQDMVDRHMDDQDSRRRLFELQSALNTQPVKTATAPSNPNNTNPLAVQDMVIGRYQIEAELGKGAMGRIYRACDLKTNHQVAIKTLQLADEFNDAELENVKQRFFREAETAGQLRHPNIVKIYEAGETDHLCWIAMELLSGHDLMRYTVTDNLLTPVMIMGIAYKAARALHYAHDNNVIHRDIKPANIMFDADRKQIKITDFGIARIADVNRTKTGIVLGTPSYMSPEQLAGHELDGRSDLFALGVMLFHLLSGELPFKGESLAMLMYMIANEPHRDLRKMRPDIAQTYPDLVAIIDKALEKDPRDRFQSGNAMADALKACAKK